MSRKAIIDRLHDENALLEMENTTLKLKVQQLQSENERLQQRRTIFQSPEYGALQESVELYVNKPDKQRYIAIAACKFVRKVHSISHIQAFAELFGG